MDEQDTTPAVWREPLASAWQGKRCRDLSTPPQSPSGPSSSVEMTGAVIPQFPAVACILPVALFHNNI
jgi:hypothetical protein